MEEEGDAEGGVADHSGLELLEEMRNDAIADGTPGNNPFNEDEKCSEDEGNEVGIGGRGNG